MTEDYHVRITKDYLVFSAGHFITYNGDGHTAYMRSNACVDNAVDAYLVKGVVPPPGLRC